MNEIVADLGRINTFDHHLIDLEINNPTSNLTYPEGDFTQSKPNTDAATEEDWYNFNKDLKDLCPRIELINQETFE